MLIISKNICTRFLITTNKTPFTHLVYTFRYKSWNMSVQTETTLGPRESGEYIVKHAKYVSVNSEGIDKLVKEVNFVNKHSDLLDTNNYKLILGNHWPANKTN